jgi:hypothetical protein
MALYPRINVPDTFDEAVRNYGGVVLREKLPSSPSFNNADYVFHFEKIVCELKCLTEDNIHSAENRARTQQLINDYYERGLITSKEINEKNWSNWPQELQTKIYSATTRSIKKRVHKADIQIRETKKELRLDGYHGIVALANDGIVSVPPAAFIHATQLVLRHYFTEVQYFIFFTANLYTAMPGELYPALFWIGLDLQRGPQMDTRFTDRLGHIFKRIASAKTGIPSLEQELEDIEGFWKAKYVKT